MIVPDMCAGSEFLFVSKSNTADSTKTVYNTRSKSILLKYFNILLQGLLFEKLLFLLQDFSDKNPHRPCSQYTHHQFCAKTSTVIPGFYCVFMTFIS